MPDPTGATERALGLKIDHTLFFTHYREAYGKLTQSKVNGLEALLTAIESDPEITDVRWAAYMLATVKHECADTWLPIEEYGKGRGRQYGKPVKVKDAEGNEYTATYYGRGYVQLTWDYNYKKMSDALGMGSELMIRPEKVLDPVIAYKIMSYGMRKGSFTGKKLASYIVGDMCDYRNARRIINGTDRADLIKGYAVKLEGILRKSLVG